MLTGDHEATALQICREVNIDPAACKFRLLPQGKLDWIKATQDVERHRVLMIGDGINDATALAASTVGVAMGAGGSAMAAAAADVVLMSNNLLRVPATILLCRQARNIMLQNCCFAIGIKFVAVILAVAGE